MVLMTVRDDRVLAGPHGPLPVRVYTPEAPAGQGLVWLHGGAFAVGDLAMAESDAVARALALRGITVVTVDYRLAPLPAPWAEESGLSPRGGAHYPVASEESAHAFVWAATSGLVPGAWAFGGASAGGNLAAGATLRLLRSGAPVPELVVLAYPTLHAVQDAPSAALRSALDRNPAADRFDAAAILFMYENYLGAPVETADIFAVPGRATAAQLAGFPPTIMINSDVDELRVSGESFATALRDAGVGVDVSTERGTIHGHLSTPEHPGFDASIERFADRLLVMRATARAD